jgi:hypothetical protein
MKYTHKQILILYNSVLRGYLNYYSFVHNYSRLASYLYFTLKGSCGKLLAAKFSMRSMVKVLTKFGKDLSFKERKLNKTEIKPLLHINSASSALAQKQPTNLKSEG